MPDFEKKIAELFLELPSLPTGNPAVISCTVVDRLAFIGMSLPLIGGKLSFKGRVGLEVSLDQGRLAARHALLVGLGSLRAALGSLNQVKQVVQLQGFVACGPQFYEVDRVLDNASQLLVDIFGEAGKHTRSAVGVHQLPQGTCVAVSLFAAIK